MQNIPVNTAGLDVVTARHAHTPRPASELSELTVTRSSKRAALSTSRGKHDDTRAARHPLSEFILL